MSRFLLVLGRPILKLRVKVIPNARNIRVKEIADGSLKVWLVERAEKGKANKALIKILADYFGLEKGKIKIVKGEKSREKVIEVCFLNFL
ncbi:MAG: hypothetical protein ACD_63C00208G0002 [uncultured bacterium]|nr:MAG: hypothetical protein ACD_63C00208G0002 [uncultured bacterium]